MPSNIIEVEAEVINFLGAIVRVTFTLEGEEMIVDISEKEFEKINLKPREYKEVEFTIGKKELSFYNSDLDFVLEPGEFEVMVGTSSVDLQKIKFFVE